MKILISAAEASSDIHASHLMRALKELYQDSVSKEKPNEKLTFFGIGGPRMQAEGLQTVVDNSQLKSMGISEVIVRIPRILRALKKILVTAEAQKPDLVIVVDYPDFHFRLAKYLKRRLGIPIVYYIPPKVWVWRKYRLRKIKKYFSKVLCIFPFEEAIYHQAGIPVKYVGNPLLDELPLDLSTQEARQHFQLAAKPSEQKVLALLPGSRPGELKNHLKIFIEAAQGAALQLRQRHVLKQDEKLVTLLALPLGEDGSHYERQVAEFKQAILEKTPDVSLAIDIRLSLGQSHLAMKAAQAGLVKSGTATLEAGLLGLPHVVVYKPNALTAFLFKYFVSYDGPVGLVNLVRDWKPGQSYAFEELLMEQVTEANLKTAILQLLDDPAYGQRMQQSIKDLRLDLLEKKEGSPSEIAAKEVLKLYQDFLHPQPVELKSKKWPSPPSIPAILSFARFLGSTLWSSVNSLRRFFLKLGVLRSVKLPSRVISVGNLQAGGSGKTPLVAQIAREAHERGLTRLYSHSRLRESLGETGRCLSTSGRLA